MPVNCIGDKLQWFHIRLFKLFFIIYILHNVQLRRTFCDECKCITLIWIWIFQVYKLDLLTIQNQWILFVQLFCWTWKLYINTLNVHWCTLFKTPFEDFHLPIPLQDLETQYYWVHIHPLFTKLLNKIVEIFQILHDDLERIFNLVTTNLRS